MELRRDRHRTGACALSCRHRLPCIGGRLACCLLQTSLRAFSALELCGKEADVTLCTDQLPMSGKDISILDIQPVQGCKLPVGSG